MKSLASHMEAAGLSVDELIAASDLDAKVVRAMVVGQYTPSPSQRQRLAAVLGVAPSEVAWGHTVPVEHIRGNGPQFGRST